MATSATNRSFIGIAKEVTPGTPIASTDFIPVTKFAPEDKFGIDEDKGFRGSMVENYGEILTSIYSTYDYSGDVFMDTIGYPLASLLADVVFTTGGGTTANTFAFATKNTGDGQPTSFTLNDFYAENNRQFPGIKFSELAFKISPDGILKYDAKSIGLGSVTAATPTPTFSALQPKASWQCVTTLGGGVVTYAEDAEVTIKRSTKPVWNLDGSAGPYKIWSGPVVVSGKLTTVMDDETQYNNLNLSAAQILDFTISTGALLTLESLQLRMTKGVYTTGKIERGKDWVELPLTFEAVANTTDVGSSAGFSPIKATLKNLKVTGTYA